MDFSTFWLLGLLVSALHEDDILRFFFVGFVSVLFFVVFVFFPFLNQEADPRFGQIPADSGRNVLIPPNRFGSLFSSVLLTQSSASFLLRAPSDSFTLYAVLTISMLC